MPPPFACPSKRRPRVHGPFRRPSCWNWSPASQALPAPWANPGLTTADGRSLTTPDVWFDDVAMAVMVHSRRYHSSPDDWDDTVDADGDLTTTGVVVAGVTPHRIRTSPNEVLRRLERTHAAATARPRPDVVATPRHLRPAAGVPDRPHEWATARYLLGGTADTKR
jgi:hypothetical protein